VGRRSMAILPVLQRLVVLQIRRQRQVKTKPLRRNGSVDTRLLTSPSRPRIRKKPTRQSEPNEVKVRDVIEWKRVNYVLLKKPSHGPIALNQIVLLLKIKD
jgi:hypothetical protein